MGDKSLGAAMMAGGIVAIAIYISALFGWGVGSLAWFWALTIVAIIAVGAVCAIVIWIGYTLLTTPAPTAPTFDVEKPPEAKSSESE